MYKHKRIYEDVAFADTIEIKENFNYIKNVLKLKEMDNVTILNSAEIGDYKIETISKRHITLVLECKRLLKKPNYEMSLYLCIPKRKYFDYVVEKVSEIGVTKIVPINSEYSTRTLSSKAKERCVGIIKKGVLQSGIECLPKLENPMEIKDIKADCGDNFLFCEYGEKFNEDAYKDFEIGSNSVSYAIGPEGGFSENEVKLLMNIGFKVVKPLRNILKVDTASVVFSGLLKVKLERNGYV